MTPKQKANSLCMKYLIQTTTDIPYGINKTIAKECALIAVDEILDVLNQIHWVIVSKDFKYWSEVKKEIELL
jgi:hypothetical protein